MFIYWLFAHVAWHICNGHLLVFVLQNKRYVKKHLFSDTDTDNAVTEVSWLTESSRKAKPQVTKYTRQALPKPKATPPQSPGRL